MVVSNDLEIHFKLNKQCHQLANILVLISENIDANQKILSHFQKFIHQKRLSLGNLFFKQEENYLPNQIGEMTILDGLDLQDNQEQNKAMIQIMKGGTIQYELVPQDVELSLIINGQKLDFNNYKLNDIHKQTDQYFLTARSLKISYSQAGSVDNDILKYTRLIRFLSYFLEKKLPTISEEELDLLEQKLPSTYLIGMEKMSKLIKDKFIKFTDNQVKSKPKGVVFYGPPRTGKSAISAECINILRLFKVFTDITPADFNNELQGQAEKMLNKICERSEVVPWQLCILFLDEIDGIAPQRTKKSSGGSKLDLTNLFLTIIEGNKKKSNLLTWGTTNRLQDMDKAFCDRLDIKIFHGIPNFETRKKFYQENVDKYSKNEKFKDLCSHEMQNKEIYNYIQQNTINFNSDALFQSMESILLKLNQNLKQIRNGTLNARELIKEILKDSALSYNNYFGSQVIPLLPNTEEIKENYSKELLNTMQCFFQVDNSEFKLNSSPLILIDLKEQ